jgi:hypothetical protein
MTEPIDLPRFTAAVRQLSDRLATGTFWRYTNGLLPGFGRFIVERPELARALAADAEELAKRRSEEEPIIAAERGENQWQASE